MPITPESFIGLARELLSDDASEVALRSATSRAYYAAYHLAKDRAEASCPQVPAHEIRGGSHELVVHRYIAEGSLTARSIAYTLRDLKAKRVIADYELGQHWKREESESHVATAAALMERIAQR